MKNLSSAIFPMMIAGLLAGLSYGLQWYVQAPAEQTSQTAPHAPDAIVTQAEVLRMGSKGTIRYRLVSPKIVHFRDDDSSYLESPLLHHFKTDGPPTSIRSQKAYVTADPSVIQFNGDVVIQRPAYRDNQAIQANMASLKVFPDDGKAESTSVVTLQRGQSRLKGTGMSLDNNRQLTELHHDVRGVFPPRNH